MDMARDQGYLVSYISKLTEYCDVLLLKSCYMIGIDEIVKNIINSDVNYINLASPVINSNIKDNPESFVASLSTDKVNVLNNIQYAPEIISFIRARYAHTQKIGSRERLKIIFATCAEIPYLKVLHEILQEKMFETKLYTSSVAEVKNYNTNILDNLYTPKIREGLYDDFDLYQIIKESSFPDLLHYKEPADFFDLLMNMIISENFSFLYKLNSPSKSIRLMESLAKYVGREISHRRICDEIRLDDITYPTYYQAILNSFLGFELFALPKKLYVESEKNKDIWDEETKAEVAKVSDYPEHCSKFYFIDANLLAYLLKVEINPKLYGNFVQFNQMFQNFVVAELIKNTSANIGSKLYYLHDEGVNFDVILTRENSNCIAFKIRSTDHYTQNDIDEFEKLREMLGEHFHRGYVIYLGKEVKQIAPDIYTIPLNYLWSSIKTVYEEPVCEPEAQEPISA